TGRGGVGRSRGEHVRGSEWAGEFRGSASSALPDHLLLREGRSGSAPDGRRVPRDGGRLLDCVGLPTEVARGDALAGRQVLLEVPTGLGLVADCVFQATSVSRRSARNTLWALCTAIPIQALRYRFVG